MRYAFLHVHAYTFLLTFTTFLFSLLGGLCIHRLGNIGSFYHGNTEHEENLQRYFTLALFAFGHFRVFGHRVRWDVPLPNWRLVVSWA
jgi:hypothetical protein